jgi:hypothetical protein
VLGFNPSQVTVHSKEPLPIQRDQAYQLSVRVMGLSEVEVETLGAELAGYAKEICKEAIKTPLPPL